MATNPNVPDTVLLAVQKAHDAKLAQEQATEALNQAKEAALLAMTKASLSKVSVADTDIEVTATVVRPTTAVVEEAKLATLISEEMWDRITVRKLDRSLLTEAIDSGLIDPDVIEEATKFGEGTAHIRWTVKVRKGLKRWSRPASGRKVVRAS